MFTPTLKIAIAASADDPPEPAKNPWPEIPPAFPGVPVQTPQAEPYPPSTPWPPEGPVPA